MLGQPIGRDAPRGYRRGAWGFNVCGVWAGSNRAREDGGTLRRRELVPLLAEKHLLFNTKMVGTLARITHDIKLCTSQPLLLVECRHTARVYGWDGVP